MMDRRRKITKRDSTRLSHRTGSASIYLLPNFSDLGKVEKARIVSLNQLLESCGAFIDDCNNGILHDEDEEDEEDDISVNNNVGRPIVSTQNLKEDQSRQPEQVIQQQEQQHIQTERSSTFSSLGTSTTNPERDGNLFSLQISTSSPFQGVKKRLLRFMDPTKENIEQLCLNARIFGQNTKTKDWGEIRSDHELSMYIDNWCSIASNVERQNLNQVVDRLCNVLDFEDHRCFRNALHCIWELVQDEGNLQTMFPNNEIGRSRMTTIISCLKDRRSLFSSSKQRALEEEEEEDTQRSTLATVQIGAASIIMATTCSQVEHVRRLGVIMGAFDTTMTAIQATLGNGKRGKEGQEHQTISTIRVLLNLLVRLVMNADELERGWFAASFARPLVGLFVTHHQTSSDIRVAMLAILRLILAPEAMQALFQSDRNYVDTKKWSPLYCSLIGLVSENSKLDLTSRVFIVELLSAVCHSEFGSCLLGFDQVGASSGRADDVACTFSLSIWSHMLQFCVWATEAIKLASKGNNQHRSSFRKATKSRLHVPHVHQASLGLVDLHNGNPGLQYETEDTCLILESLLIRALKGVQQIAMHYSSIFPNEQLPSFIMLYFWRSIMHVMVETPAPIRETIIATLAYMTLLNGFGAYLPPDCQNDLSKVIARDNISRVQDEKSKEIIHRCTSFILSMLSDTREGCIMLAMTMEGLTTFLNLLTHLVGQGSEEACKLATLATLQFCHFTVNDRKVKGTKGEGGRLKRSSKTVEEPYYHGGMVSEQQVRQERNVWNRGYDMVTPDSVLDVYFVLSLDEWFALMDDHDLVAAKYKSPRRNKKKPTMMMMHDSTSSTNKSTMSMGSGIPGEETSFTSSHQSMKERIEQEKRVLDVSKEELGRLCHLLLAFAERNQDDTFACAHHLSDALGFALSQNDGEKSSLLKYSDMESLMRALDIISQQAASLEPILALLRIIHMALRNQETVAAMEFGVDTLIYLYKVGIALIEKQQGGGNSSVSLIDMVLKLLWTAASLGSNIVLHPDVIGLLYCGIDSSSPLAVFHRRICANIVHQMCEHHPSETCFEAIKVALMDEMEPEGEQKQQQQKKEIHFGPQDYAMEFVLECLHSYDLALKGIGALIFASLRFDKASQQRLEVFHGGRRLLEMAWQRENPQVQLNALFGIYGLIQGNEMVQVKFAKTALLPLLILAQDANQKTVRALSKVPSNESLASAQSREPEQYRSDLKRLLKQILEALSKNMKIRTIFYQAELSLRRERDSITYETFQFPWDTPLPSSSASSLERCLEERGKNGIYDSSKSSHMIQDRQQLSTSHTATSKASKSSFAIWLESAFEPDVKKAQMDQLLGKFPMAPRAPQRYLHQNLCRPIHNLWRGRMLRVQEDEKIDNNLPWKHDRDAVVVASSALTQQQQQQKQQQVNRWAPRVDSLKLEKRSGTKIIFEDDRFLLEDMKNSQRSDNNKIKKKPRKLHRAKSKKITKTSLENAVTLSPKSLHRKTSLKEFPSMVTMDQGETDYNEDDCDDEEAKKKQEMENALMMEKLKRKREQRERLLRKLGVEVSVPLYRHEMLRLKVGNRSFVFHGQEKPDDVGKPISGPCHISEERMVCSFLHIPGSRIYDKCCGMQKYFIDNEHAIFVYSTLEEDLKLPSPCKPPLPTAPPASKFSSNVDTINKLPFTSGQELVSSEVIPFKTMVHKHAFTIPTPAHRIGRLWTRNGVFDSITIPLAMISKDLFNTLNNVTEEQDEDGKEPSTQKNKKKRRRNKKNKQ